MGDGKIGVVEEGAIGDEARCRYTNGEYKPIIDEVE